MKTDVMFSSKTDLWETPKDFFTELDKEFRFTVDVCTTSQNTKCKKYYTKQENGLLQPWNGRVWCNPPYGSEIKNWVERGYKAVQTQEAEIVVMLLPARTDTRWFHDWIYGKSEVRFVKGRLKFGDSKNSAPFPSMVVVFRNSKEDQHE